MSLHTKLDNSEMVQFVELLHESLKVRSHFEFLLWSQGNLQQFLPHDIMIAAWGDFSLGLVYFDIVSAIPGIRTGTVQNTNLTPLLKRLFGYWNEHSRSPFTLTMNQGIFEDSEFERDQLDGNFKHMRSALVHAIKDVRGRHDCLYVLMSSSTVVPDSARSMLEALLPYMDSSLRQLDHLPEQMPAQEPAPVEPSYSDEDMGALSTRELEIMEWVRNGKTNFEIGMILDISAFTVKNHLQRIFRKLDVVNRAQAVAKLSKMTELNAI
jgi:transcriptional regulator EpsA